MRAKPPTRWTGEVQTFKNRRKGVSVSVSGATVADLIADVVRTATYYVRECGYEVYVTEVVECCIACGGAGKVAAKSRTGALVRCVACRGEGRFSEAHPSVEWDATRSTAAAVV